MRSFLTAPFVLVRISQRLQAVFAAAAREKQNCAWTNSGIPATIEVQQMKRFAGICDRAVSVLVQPARLVKTE
jgi:hypothetical protein